MKDTPCIRTRIAPAPLVASTDPSRFARDRHRDFTRLCRLIFRRSKTPMTQRQIVEEALSHEAPGYYVDYTYALRVISNVMDMPDSVLGRCSRGKWLEITRRCRAELEGGRARDLGHALALVLSSGRASGFFMSPATAIRILQREGM